MEDSEPSGGEASAPQGSPGLPFTRFGAGSGGQDQWWSWVLDLDPFAPATVPAGPPVEDTGNRSGAAGRPQDGAPTSPPERRRAVVSAGHHDDAATARRHLDDSDPEVRAAALGALERTGDLSEDDLLAALADPDPGVRRRACELAAGRPGPELRPRLADLAAVAEMAAWALGERADAEAVGDLSAMATGHEDPLCREAAVAALGAIGDTRGLPAVLAALGDRPAIRRRAVLALAPFEGPEVEAALERARSDRDWQVRQAAEDLS